MNRDKRINYRLYEAENVRIENWNVWSSLINQEKIKSNRPFYRNKIDQVDHDGP